MTCPLCDKATQIRAGLAPEFIAELSESYAILGENQGCRAWVVLILKDHADHLAALSQERQLRLFADVSKVAGAQRALFGDVRINYECLGNVVSHIHWHVIPRHADDHAPRGAVWGWPPEVLRGTLTETDRAALRDRLRAELRNA